MFGFGVPVPEDAILVGEGGKSPGREKGVASFGTGGRGSAPNSSSWRWRPGETPRRPLKKRECGVWAGDVRTRFLVFRQPGLEKPRSAGAGEGMWCARRWSECQRTQFLLGEGVKAQVVKRGLRPLALGRGGVHQIPSRGVDDLGKRRGVLRKTGMWCLWWVGAHQIPGFRQPGLEKPRSAGDREGMWCARGLRGAQRAHRGG